ncbi:hypothetical protein [Acetobacter sacchari]
MSGLANDVNQDRCSVRSKRGYAPKSEILQTAIEHFGVYGV